MTASAAGIARKDGTGTAMGTSRTDIMGAASSRIGGSTSRPSGRVLNGAQTAQKGSGPSAMRSPSTRNNRHIADEI